MHKSTYQLTSFLHSSFICGCKRSCTVSLRFRTSEVRNYTFSYKLEVGKGVHCLPLHFNHALALDLRQFNVGLIADVTAVKTVGLLRVSLMKVVDL